MRKKLTVSIGIPALNEEANIRILLESLISQIMKGFELEKILVISDGSTDRTVEIARAVKGKRIKVVKRLKRKGINFTQNEILKKVNSDILVLLDADVLPEGKLFLKNLIEPFKNDSDIGLVSGDLIPLPSNNIVEKALSDSHESKRFVFDQLRSGNNIFRCHGAARAISKKLYTDLRWPDDCPEDSYSYLFCLNKGYKFFLQKKARVFFRPPTNLADHAKQTNRFFLGIKRMENYFDPQFVRKAYYIPKQTFLKLMFKFLLENPISFLVYASMTVYIKLFLRNKYQNITKHSLSESSKKLVVN